MAERDLFYEYSLFVDLFVGLYPKSATISLLDILLSGDGF
jgi:hypothetical protein